MVTSKYYYSSSNPKHRMSPYRSSQRSLSPPGLSRASTPEASDPATPTMSHSFPKLASSKPQVGFASPVATSAYRIPGWDERSVMRAFASHASHCEQCADPARTLRHGLTLCRRGTEYAKDIGKYFYCSENRPFSTIDRDQRHERVQVEVPPEYGVVKTLFESLSRGLRFANLKQRQVEFHQQPYAESSPRKSAPTTETYEVKPHSSHSRRQRANRYTSQTETRQPRYETRTPSDYESTPRESKHGSLYVSPERRTTKKYVIRYP